MRLTLEVEGYAVYCAEDGQAALELLDRIPCPSLILLDLMMPRMNGWQFAEVVSKDPRLNKIPTVVVSAFVEEASPLPAAKAVIKKPVDIEVLLKTVEKYCGASTEAA